VKPNTQPGGDHSPGKPLRTECGNRLIGLPKREAYFIEPMECLPVTRLHDGPQWAFEIKLNGYRALGIKSRGKVNLYSRRKKSFNTQYPYLVEALNELPDDTIVDGEVVSLGLQTHHQPKSGLAYAWPEV
jgi:ATP-dependent DNA ligase